MIFMAGTQHSSYNFLSQNLFWAPTVALCNILSFREAINPHWKYLHSVVVWGLSGQDPESYAGGSLLLVGPPLPDRSKVMAQTKRRTLVLQVGGWAAG
jgi:hypothetical protein